MTGIKLHKLGSRIISDGRRMLGVSRDVWAMCAHLLARWTLSRGFTVPQSVGRIREYLSFLFFFFFFLNRYVLYICVLYVISTRIMNMTDRICFPRRPTALMLKSYTNFWRQMKSGKVIQSSTHPMPCCWSLKISSRRLMRFIILD